MMMMRGGMIHLPGLLGLEKPLMSSSTLVALPEETGSGLVPSAIILLSIEVVRIGATIGRGPISA